MNSIAATILISAMGVSYPSSPIFLDMGTGRPTAMSRYGDVVYGTDNGVLFRWDSEIAFRSAVDTAWGFAEINSTNGMLIGGRDASGRAIIHSFDPAHPGPSIGSVIGDIQAMGLALDVYGWYQAPNGRRRAAKWFVNLNGDSVFVPFGPDSSTLNTEARVRTTTGGMVYGVVYNNNNPDVNASILGPGGYFTMGLLPNMIESDILDARTPNRPVGVQRAADGTKRAVVWNPVSQAIDLGIPNSEAVAITRDEQRVYVNSDAGPYVWTENGLIEWSSVLLRNHFDTTGWTNMKWADVSEDGNVISGYGDFNGVQHGWMMILPEPMTLALVAIGGVMVIRRKRG